MISVVITAGGTSSRFKGQNKLLFELDGKPIIFHTVNTFLKLDFVNEIIVSANESIIETLNLMFKGIDKIKVIKGGNTRQESVYLGLQNCSNCDYVIIHDGARPFITQSVISSCLDKAKEVGGAIVAVKTVDTIKIVDENGLVVSTPDRKTLWNAQTPQIFKYDLIYSFHEKYKNENFTDDSLLFEYSNRKITTINDVKN